MRRPWNIINQPVYSLATSNSDGKVNMNVCTYVTAVSMLPKIYTIAIDYHSRTFDNLMRTDEVVLQVLNQQHMGLVKSLGKKTGKKMDKMSYLEKKGLLSNWLGFHVLKNANAYLKLRKVKNEDIGGDHEIFFFQCEKFKTNSEEGILMFNDLIEHGIIL